MAKKKTIALIFATGTVLSSLRNRSIVFVESESDIAPWLEAIPEISLIADIEPHFLLPESAIAGYNNTLQLSGKIHDLSTQVDGIVVLMRTESIIQQATLLNFLNQHIKIPIIFTGAVVSPQALAEGVSSDLSKINITLSLKSNVINAIQVATRDFQGFGIMYGNRLIEPIRAQRENIEALNVFGSVDGKYAGRVEFGISLSQGKKSAQPAKYYTTFSPQVAVIDSELFTADSLKHLTAEAVIIRIRENEQLSIAMYELLCQQKKLIILYNYWYTLEHKRLITVSHLTEASLIAKVMWLVAENLSVTEFKQRITENVIGEILS